MRLGQRDSSLGTVDANGAHLQPRCTLPHRRQHARHGLLDRGDGGDHREHDAGIMDCFFWSRSTAAPALANRAAARGKGPRRLRASRHQGVVVQTLTQSCRRQEPQCFA